MAALQLMYAGSEIVMGNFGRLGGMGVLLSACMGLAGTAQAACNGSQNLVAQFQAHPTQENSGMLGSWYAAHHQFDCALQVFRAGMKANPQSAELHYLTGLSLAALKHPDDAITELRKSIELDPRVLKPHIMLASLEDEAGRSEEAEREWRKALALDPNSEPVLEGLTADFMRRQDYASVIQLLQNAPRNEKLDIALSRALGSLNDFDAAASVLNQGMQAHPGSVPLAQAMVVVLVKQHKHEDAIKLVRSILEKHPGDQDTQVTLLRLLVLSDHVDEARVLGPKLLAARPRDAEVLFLNGLTERSIGDNAKSKDLLENAVQLEPDFPNFRFELGNTLVLLKEWPEARQQLEKALALGADEPEVHLALGKTLRALGDAQAAAAEVAKYQQMKQAAEATLEAADAAAQGDASLEAGKLSEAAAHYRDAIAGQPRNANYQYKLAIALQRAGDTAGERKALEDAIRLDPHMPGAQNSLGYLLSRNGDADAAVEHFRMAVQAAPGWTEAWINLAAELAVTSHFAEARQAVAKALELEPGNAQARELNDQLARDPAAQPNRP